MLLIEISFFNHVSQCCCYYWLFNWPANIVSAVQNASMAVGYGTTEFFAKNTLRLYGTRFILKVRLRYFRTLFECACYYNVVTYRTLQVRHVTTFATHLWRYAPYSTCVSTMHSLLSICKLFITPFLSFEFWLFFLLSFFSQESRPKGVTWLEEHQTWQNRNL